jgi:hypothetical protein
MHYFQVFLKNFRLEANQTTQFLGHLEALTFQK